MLSYTDFFEAELAEFMSNTISLAIKIHCIAYWRIEESWTGKVTEAVIAYTFWLFDNGHSSSNEQARVHTDVYLRLSVQGSSDHDTSTLCWIGVGQPSSTLVQNVSNIEWAHGFPGDLHSDLHCPATTTQQTRHFHPSSFECWTSVADAEPAFKRRWVNVWGCLLGRLVGLRGANREKINPPPGVTI